MNHGTYTPHVTPLRASSPSQDYKVCPGECASTNDLSPPLHGSFTARTYDTMSIVVIDHTTLNIWISHNYNKIADQYVTA